MNTFITGQPGCGKSTLINELRKEVKGEVAGILTPDIRENGRKGFWIADIASGKKKVMASVDIKPAKVSKYGVDVDAIDDVVDTFLKSFEKADYAFIDEIGKMEFYSQKFKDMLDVVLKSNKVVIATLHRNYVDRFKDMGEVFVLTRENYSGIKGEILKRVGSYL